MFLNNERTVEKQVVQNDGKNEKRRCFALSETVP